MRPWRTGIRLPQKPTPAPRSLPRPAELCLPLQWGETPLVAVGERVLRGARIADGAGETVPLHASASGIVRAIGERLCADVRQSCIVIDCDEEDENDPTIRRRALLDELNDEQLLGIIYDAGIRLPDGTALATAVADAGRCGKALVISAMDAEPFLCAQDAAACFESERARCGIRVLTRLLAPEQVILAFGAHQKSAIRAWGQWSTAQMRIAVLPDIYPNAQPPILSALLGLLRPGETMEARGVLVLPMSAAVDCARAAYDGLPVMEQLLSVDWGTGRAVYQVPLGMPLRAILEEVGQEGTAICGGPMTGTRLKNPDIPVTKGLSGLTILPQSAAQERTSCIRCERCAAVCPMGLRPYLSAQRGHDFSDCMRCGACEYSCPAGLPLVQAMHRRGKELVDVG